MANETYEAWLLIPGNHRVILELKKQISEKLNRPAKIDSWRTLYEYYEVIMNIDRASANIFMSIFSTNPPTIETGASKSQIQIFETHAAS